MDLKKLSSDGLIAQRVVSTNLKKLLDPEVFDRDLEALKSHGEHFTSAWRTSLLDRRIARLSDGGDITQYAFTVISWHPKQYPPAMWDPNDAKHQGQRRS